MSQEDGYLSGADFFKLVLERPSASMTKKPFEVFPQALQLPRLRSYIDETGDRGGGSGSSPVFGMASVIATDDGEASARATLRQLRTDFNTPAGRPMSWKADIRRDHSRAIHAAELLQAVEGLMVVYVVAKKDELDPGSYRDDITLLYNVTAYATLQRTLWAAQRFPGGSRHIEVRFGHVKKHDPTDTHNYFQIKRNMDASRVPFWLMTHLSWVGAEKYEMSQVADLYAGFMKAATWPNNFGRVEGAYLRAIWEQIRKVNGCPLSLGFMYRPRDDLARNSGWWPCGCLRCSAT